MGGEDLRHTVLVCDRCGLTHCHTEPGFDWTTLYGSVWREPPPSRDHRVRFQQDAERLGPGNGRRVFEVGCSSGFLLSLLRDRGWRTAGCDPDGEAAAQARSEGHDVVGAPFGSEVVQPADRVVMGDVLEHLDAPLPALRLARTMLGPEGHLYVRVPNVDDLSEESLGDVFHVQHRVVFTPDTLAAMLRAAGLAPLEIGTSPLTVFALAAPGEEVSPQPAPRVRDRAIGTVSRYSMGLDQRRQAVGERLAGLRGRSLALYGAGNHGAELLRHTPLGQLAGRLVDSDSKLWGEERYGMRVESPQELRSDPPEVVVIASRAYQDEIALDLEDLRESGVEVVRLYQRGGLF